MFKNYCKAALRNLQRHKLYTFINVFGLALGIACCILIMLFVRHEWSYDSFHKNADALFRVLTKTTAPDGTLDFEASQPMPLAPALHAEFPQVKGAARFRTGAMIITYGDKSFSENVTFTDPDIFSMFAIEFVNGNPASALKNPTDIVLTQTIAKKYFGEENPIGKLLSIQTRVGVEAFAVAGVIKPLPSNSCVQFELLANISQNSEYSQKKALWPARSCDVFVELASGTSAAAFQRKMPTFVQKYYAEIIKHEQDNGALSKSGEAFQIEFQPIRNVYLDTRVQASREEQSSPTYSYILAGIAILVLLIACINFTLVAISRSANRAREVGIRKVVGAARSQLLGQFLGEAFLLCIAALLVGVALAELFLPAFNQLAGKQLSLNVLFQGAFFANLIGLLIVIGFVAGSYPALILSRFEPVEVLKKTTRVGGKNLLTQLLVTLQFSLAILLIAGALIMSKQLRFLLTKNLGYNAAQVVVIPSFVSDSDANVEDITERLRNRTASNPNIVSISKTSVAFAHGYRLDGFQYNGENKRVVVYRVDKEYLKTLGIQLKEGRNFIKGRTDDEQTGIIVNEAFLRHLGWSEPAVGSHLNGTDDKELNGLEVIGVVKDFHFTSLREEIMPVMLWEKTQMRLHHILVRITPSKMAATIDDLRRAWNEVAPNRPFDFSFLDQDVQRTYQFEEKWTSLVEYSSFFAVSLACLGLLGLVTLAVVNRTKELGIRKVLGASVAGIIALLSKDFIKLVLIANVMAWPVAYFAMNKWLQNFAYHIDLGWTVFALAGGIALLIALLTVSAQAIKAALANPVDSLRYE